MKGIILAGGKGTRLHPLTLVTNKHLLPVYSNVMIYYPINTLVNSGIKDIMIITGKEHAGAFIDLLGSGEKFGAKFSYKVQEKAGGIAEALGLCEYFIDGDNVAVILGDNIFGDNLLHGKSFSGGAKIFLKKVNTPERFGVAVIDKNKNKIKRIIEKPNFPVSNFAVTGLYVYDSMVFEVIKTLIPSERGELEITDVNNWYIKRNEMKYEIVNGFWHDMGTHESLFIASEYIRSIERKK